MCISKTSTQIVNKWNFRLSCNNGRFPLASWKQNSSSICNPIRAQTSCSVVFFAINIRFLCGLSYAFPDLTICHLLGNRSLLARPFVISAHKGRPHTLPKFPWGPSNLLLNPLSLSGLISHGIEWLPGLSLHLHKSFLLRDSGLGA